MPNRITKISPFEAHFVTSRNTEFSNLVTKPTSDNLSYNNIKSFYIEKRLLQNPTLIPAAIWDRDTNSETNLDIRYRLEQPSPNESTSPRDSGTADASDSDDTPLSSIKRGTTIPSNFKFQIGDKTTIIDQTRRNLARKSIKRRKPEQRGTFKIFGQ